MATGERLSFASDYMEGAHPAILERLTETNLQPTAGYGLDPFSESARERIRKACGLPDAAVHFISGGTQANAIVIGAALRPWQGVLAAASGHISVHEAGAIELGGHKVLELPHRHGKISAEDVARFAEAYRRDANRDHMVMPGMVYISQPTEYGTLYSRAELAAIKGVCREHGMVLYLDGARLAYALASPRNDATLRDIGELCDAFYIGGTKCGALCGEAVVLPDPGLIPHFFTIIKQHGALMAKGRLMGIQFDVLFEDDLYMRIGHTAIQMAERLQQALLAKGYRLPVESATNQVFVSLAADDIERLARQVDFSFWENEGEGRSIVRFATSWATKDEDVERLIALL